MFTQLMTELRWYTFDRRVARDNINCKVKSFCRSHKFATWRLCECCSLKVCEIFSSWRAHADKLYHLRMPVGIATITSGVEGLGEIDIKIA